MMLINVFVTHYLNNCYANSLFTALTTTIPIVSKSGILNRKLIIPVAAKIDLCFTQSGASCSKYRYPNKIVKTSNH